MHQPGRDTADRGRRHRDDDRAADPLEPPGSFFDLRAGLHALIVEVRE
jgi:hypothetical protein